MQGLSSEEGPSSPTPSGHGAGLQGARDATLKRSVLWGVTHRTEPRGHKTGAWSSKDQKTCYSAESPHNCSADTETPAHFTQTTRNHLFNYRNLGFDWSRDQRPQHAGVRSRVSANTCCVKMTVLPPSCFCPQGDSVIEDMDGEEAL